MNDLIDVLKYVFSVLIGAFITFGSFMIWKTKVNMRLDENEKDINNLKLVKETLVKKEDFRTSFNALKDHIEKVDSKLDGIKDQLINIAKSIPAVCNKNH